MTIAPLAAVAGLMVPQLGEQATPFWERVQVTPLLVASFFTVAVNCCTALNATLAEVGDTDTEIGRTVTVALPETLEFVADVATTKVPTKW